MNRRKNPYLKLDWTLIGCWLALMLFGWINIFSMLHGENHNIFDFSQKYGMHFIWICISIITAVLIIRVIPAAFWQGISWIAYGGVILLLLATLALGVSSHGSQAWIQIGSFRLQPAEFSKITTSLALAAVMSKYGFTLKSMPNIMKVAGLLLLPMALILLEKETGSVLVYVGFLVVLFREGMSGWILAIGFLIVLEFILTIITSPYVAMVVGLAIFLLVSLLNVFTANNTLAVLLSGPMASDCADRFRIGRARLASLIDTASCIVQGFLPYGGQILIAVGLGRAAGLDLASGDVICALYYPPVLAAAVFVSMFIRRRGN